LESGPMIMRLPGSFPTRCRAVVHNGVATLFAVAHAFGPSMYDQTKAALSVADKTLAEVGSSKDRILTATVFIADMAQKDEMNRAWDEWADRDNPPMRVCVSTGLTGASLVEMLFTATAA
jgi:enamine deaminase RidA (YjgF/YER057c/UK114 family)